MKSIYIFSFLFLSLNSVAQEYITIDTTMIECYYTYNFQQDSLNINSRKSQEMILQVGSKSSKFASVNKLYVDSLLMIYKDESPDIAAGKILPMVMGAGIHAFCNFEIYKNYPGIGNIITTGYYNNKHLKVIEENRLDWKIVEDMDSVILGLRCNMAQTYYAGRNYVVWFTPDIPINDGPYKFCGLPGLVLDVQDKQNQHHFSLTGLKRNTGKAICFIKNNYVEVSPPDFVRAVHLRSQLMYDKILHEDGITPSNDESKARMLERQKSRNNFIEKY